jgi:hypothetical protein
MARVGHQSPPSYRRKKRLCKTNDNQFRLADRLNHAVAVSLQLAQCAYLRSTTGKSAHSGSTNYSENIETSPLRLRKLVDASQGQEKYLTKSREASDQTVVGWVVDIGDESDKEGA